jgi:cobalt-zinc-cadmium efflux system outer membrane protein
VFVRGSAPDPGARRSAIPAVALGFFSIAFTAVASDEAGRRLNLASALALAQAKGFDALLAQAAVEGAAGDADTAGRLPNPAFSGSYLHATSVPVPGGETSASGYALSAGDQGALEGFASGKRSLRVRAAASALAAARSNREDALRILRRETARAFYDALLAQASERVSRDVAKSYARTLDLVDMRLRYGAASKVDRARVETAALEADQGATAAAADAARARAALGLWLGGEDLDTVSLEGSLEGAVPGWLAAADPAALRAEAIGARPDVRAARADLERAEAALDLARRQRLPDVALAVGYTRQGPEIAPVTPPTLSLGASLELPVFSQRQGEIARAESDRVSARIALERAEARASAEARSAWASLAAAREQVGRMESALLARAREARELVRYQYREGAVSLLDLLDAERTALQVELEHERDLYDLRVAVAEIEAALGRTVTP